MLRLHFYGVTTGVYLPKVRQKSIEQAVIRHTSSNQQEVSQKIRERLWLCQHCGVPLIQGTPIKCDLAFGTPHELKTKGFPVFARGFGFAADHVSVTDHSRESPGFGSVAYCTFGVGIGYFQGARRF